ncbi:endonuclease domain-containing protein [Frateuria sp. GZRe14]|uniref:endonuclease domain-containing protein n=1 Tax=Frateuria sp. GZRe14 TaxID=3351534 RepID=UPI003EDC0716
MKRMNVERAPGLRLGMTDAETALWYRLRNWQWDGCKFRRQHEVDRYVVDFVCIEANVDRGTEWRPALGATAL